MPPVADERSWPQDEDEAEGNLNIRQFNPVITGHIQKNLLDCGLFKSLPAPDDPAAEALGDTVVITLKDYRLAKVGNNLWTVPNLLLNGSLLPVFGAVNLATAGEIDMGAYIMPSSRMGTQINAQLVYTEADTSEPVLDISYQVREEMGNASERELRDGEGAYGTRVGRQYADASLDALSEKIARDARWNYLDRFRTLARIKSRMKETEELDQKAGVARESFELMTPMRFSSAEVHALRDVFITADLRAKLFNEMRAEMLGLQNPDDLPGDQRMTPGDADKLFDDPSLNNVLVEAEISRDALKIISGILRPSPKDLAKAAEEEKAQAEAMLPGEKPRKKAVVQPGPEGAKADGEEAPMETPEEAAVRDALAMDLVKAMKNKPILQSLLLDEAEKAVGPAWPRMQMILTQIGSPSTKAYLETREKQAS